MTIKKYCKDCKYYDRRKSEWHAIYPDHTDENLGQKYPYGYCKKYKKACIQVKYCEEVTQP